MKNSKLIIKLSAIITILLLMCGISSAQKYKEIDGGTTVKLNGFSVLSPSGDDWEYQVTKNKNQVWFIDESSNFLTGSKNLTNISVFKDSLLVSPDKPEKEYADNFLEEELDIMRQQRQSDTRIFNIRKYDTTTSGKNYHVMFYNYNTASIGYYSDNILFLYFPENFSTSGLFFGFLITSAYNQPLGLIKINSAETKPIYSMIRNFKLLK